MYAIISELNSQSAQKVEELRFKAVEACGGDPMPLQWPLHLSWQGAESYQLTEVEIRLRTIARTFAPIVTRIEGVGVFTGPSPLLYLPVTRTPELAALNETIWEALAPLATNPNGYFSPDQWVPHITILYGTPQATEAIACMVRQLLTEPLHLQITLDHLYMGFFEGEQQGITYRFPLLGQSSQPAL